MHVPRLAAVAVLAVAVVVVSARPQDHAREQEVARIRGHFDSVLVELGAGGSPARKRLIAELLRYSDGGEFPHNYDFSRATPYFVDRETGVPCAVANLLRVTGRYDIVERVRMSNNNVWVGDLAADTAFTAWLGANDITLAEAARIQLPYERSSPSPVAIGALVVGAPSLLLGSTALSLWNASGNADGHRTWASKAGIGFGLATVAMGAGVMAADNMGNPAARLLVAAGTASTFFSLRSVRRHASIVASARESERSRVEADAQVMPLISDRGEAGARVSLSLKF